MLAEIGEVRGHAPPELGHLSFYGSGCSQRSPEQRLLQGLFLFRLLLLLYPLLLHLYYGPALRRQREQGQRDKETVKP